MLCPFKFNRDSDDPMTCDEEKCQLWHKWMKTCAFTVLGNSISLLQKFGVAARKKDGDKEGF